MGYGDGVPGSGPVKAQTVTIPINTATSGVIDKGAHAFLALLMPSALTGTAMTFTASHDNTTYVAVYDDSGNAVSITIAASRWIAMSPTVMAKLAPFRYLKLVSGSNEAAARTIEVVSR